MDIKSFVNKASKHLNNNLFVWIAIVGTVVFLIISLVASRIINNLSNTGYPSNASDQRVLATQQVPEQLLTSTATSTPFPIFTPTPTTSVEWKVIKNDEVVKIGKYTYAVVTFQNVGDGSIKKGQCQQPNWEKPEIGHIYNLVNTFRSEKADYWLFIPVEGVNNSIYQRFAPLP